MGQRCRSVSVSHFPLVFASVAPGVFVLPVAHDVFPPCDDTEAAAAQRLSLDDFEDEMRVRARRHRMLYSLSRSAEQHAHPSALSRDVPLRVRYRRDR